MVVNDESDGQVIFSFIFESSPVFLHQRHYDGFLLVFPPVYSEVILRVGLKAAKIVETSASIFSRNLRMKTTDPDNQQEIPNILLLANFC